MIVQNAERESVLGASIELAGSSATRAKGLLGRDGLDAGEGMLFKHCASLHTFFMRFAIDIIFADREGRVLKVSHAVAPYRLCAAPLRAYYALELPPGSIDASGTQVNDHLVFLDEEDLRATADESVMRQGVTA